MKEKNSIFPQPFYWLFVIAIFFGSVWIRLVDINDLPLDFHPTRQLFSALKARGIYYQSAPNIPDWQREMAMHQWKLQATIEPEIVERLAVFAYQKTGFANLTLPRIISIAFWVVGGIFLFFSARRLVSPDGALLTASFYLYLPYGVLASRSFQPDPLMMLLIAAFIWALAGWDDERTWSKAIFAGLFGGLAILVKMIAVFLIAMAAIFVVLKSKTLKEAFNDSQTWTIAALSILPIALYFIYGVIIDGFLTQQFGGRFFPEMLLTTSFYLRWGIKLDAVIGYLAIALSLLGLFLFPRNKKGVLLGLWGGYILYGLYFNYHFSTHDYYQMPFIIVSALSLAPLGEMLSEDLRTRVSTGFFERFIVFLVWTLALLGAAWTVRAELRSVDYFPLAESYLEVGDLLRDEGSVVALSKDYGYRLNYWGWLNSTHWPSEGDLWYQEKRGDPQEFEQVFNQHVKNRDFFLITDFYEWETQEELREYLLAQYPIYAEGGGYLVFDLWK